MRLHSTKSATWKDYNECEVALDVKLTGAEHLGLSGVTMKQYLTHARAVFRAARSEDSRVGRCSVLAFLARRPACSTIPLNHVMCSRGFSRLRCCREWDSEAARAQSF